MTATTDERRTRDAARRVALCLSDDASTLEGRLRAVLSGPAVPRRGGRAASALAAGAAALLLTGAALVRPADAARRGSVPDATPVAPQAPEAEKGHKACQSNLKVLALAALLYVREHDDRYPTLGSPAALRKTLASQMKSLEKRGVTLAGPAAFSCPVTGKPYAGNAALSGKELASLPDPGRVTMLFDAAAHGDGSRNAAHADGHVKSVSGAASPASKPTATANEATLRRVLDVRLELARRLVAAERHRLREERLALERMRAARDVAEQEALAAARAPGGKIALPHTRMLQAEQAITASRVAVQRAEVRLKSAQVEAARAAAERDAAL